MKSAEDPSFDRMWSLYERSFPLEERRPRLYHEKAMREEPSFVCAIEESGAGLLFHWLHPKFIYIEHLAVQPSERGRGVGSWLLSRLPRDRRVILEIDPVEDENSRRRLRFYERNGYEMQPYPHEQLPFVAGGAPVPMRLLSRPGKMGAELAQEFETFLERKVMQYRPLYS